MRWNTYEHMDVVGTCLCFYDFYILLTICEMCAVIDCVFLHVNNLL